ncbi:hypothetical protein [Parageobacillus thermoglucosidasius]|uniref:hypothetical protein n=1 Tax=Parageobacillus thermoglucosidasius TaxID=1426 RepID=UPI002E23FAB7|nr:hypothetical protein [Parageobacillus thermoglucosidasius]MED4915463.1 hypothetical protein [Parageobacillus thermoglucosidasius]MED4945861.1 hypothetical protein [Parageobacillus thermoglucosidasius]MED4984340.1 hypothetical protein [Parageobacillus thermoglucosidasius]
MVRETIKKELSELLHIPVESIDKKLSAAGVSQTISFQSKRRRNQKPFSLKKRGNSSCHRERSAGKRISIRRIIRPSYQVYKNHHCRRIKKIT